MIKRVMLGLLCLSGFACLVLGSIDASARAKDTAIPKTGKIQPSHCYRINRAGERIPIPCNIRVRQGDRESRKRTADRKR